MKVTLYAISRNEEKNIEKFLQNAKKFDDVVVVDTGSIDNTVQLLKDVGIKVYEHPQTREEFDFSVARNQALSYVKTDWAFALDFNEDVDEFYPEGFGVIADEFTTFNHLRFDDNGTGEPVQSNEVHTRFHRVKNYTWVNAVHEVPNFIPTEDYPNPVDVNTTIKITKKINKTVDKEIFYFSICEREHKKDPTNWYWIWFIFNHYFNVQNMEKALEYGQEFLNVSKPYFDSFRIIAFIHCSQILLSTGNFQQGMNYAFHAVSEGMNIGGVYLSHAFEYLFELSKRLNDPNLIIFVTGFNPNMESAPERIDAINKLISNNLSVPISVGELIDKITILQIKSQYTDNEYIHKELEELNKIKYNIKYTADYEIELKKVNEKLWIIEDKIRQKEKLQEFDDEFIKLARSVYMTNDKRSEIKRKINEETGSHYKEIKLY